jgi:dihydrofolate reductase
MKKIILSVAVSLDGFIEGSKGEYDWCPPPSAKEMKGFMDGVDSIFVGRKSFELIGKNSFPGKKLYVFSNTMDSNQKGISVVARDVIATVKSIKKEGGKDIWLYGGANLTTTFLNEDLIDEMWLGIVPIILGAGKPLFQDISQRRHFTIAQSTQSEGYISVKLKRK